MQTTLTLYEELKADGTVKNRQGLVYGCLRLYGELTDREIMDRLGWNDRNMVSPRRKELVNAQMVMYAGYKREHQLGNGRVVSLKVWRAV